MTSLLGVKTNRIKYSYFRSHDLFVSVTSHDAMHQFHTRHFTSFLCAGDNSVTLQCSDDGHWWWLDYWSAKGVEGEGPYGCGWFTGLDIGWKPEAGNSRRPSLELNLGLSAPPRTSDAHVEVATFQLRYINIASRIILIVALIYTI